MLRVSEFCRGPLSPVPSSGNRGRRREKQQVSPSDVDDPDDHSISDPASTSVGIEGSLNGGGPGSAVFPGRNSLDHEREELDDGEGDGDDEICCPVRLQAWSSPSLSDPASSTVVRVQLDVLKNLSLRDGDYAYLERHLLVGCDVVTTTPARSPCTNDTILQKVAIRLGLMDEDEEQQHRLKLLALTSETDHSARENNLCLVPPVVLANLGIPPQVLWRQQNNAESILSEEGVAFRLRTIQDDDDNHEDSSDDDDLAWKKTFAFRSTESSSPQRRRRKRIARRVLLRPLGRATRSPCLEFLATKASRKPSSQSHDEENNNGDQQRKGLPAHRSGGLPLETTAAEKDDESDGEAWIYPSRASIILQESKLCEVRYNSKSNKGGGPQEQKICYYEVLLIEEAKEANVFAKEDDEEEDEDECFFLTTNSTQFELDSSPLFSHSNVRRLPVPLPFDCGNHDKTRVTTDKIEVSDEQQSSKEKMATISDSLITPRRSFSFSEEIGQSLEIDASIEDKISEEKTKYFSFHPDWETVAMALLDAPPIHAICRDSETTSISTASRILHIVGSDRDHDLVACVSTAASMVGMQSISIRGLAAFGYQHRQNSTRQDSISSSVTARSPMIEQQLAGIDAAFDHVAKRRMEPCVLHFYDVDEELASVANDKELRCQIEDRLWEKWTEGAITLSKEGRSWQGRQFSGSFSRGEDDCHTNSPMTNRLDHRYTPRLAIVISTKSPLEKGPWMERLLFSSITLSLPDDNYIRFLWKTTNLRSDIREISDDAKNTQSVILTEAMMRLLRGRPKHEIIWLKNEMLFRSEESIGEEDHDSANTRHKEKNKAGKKKLPNDRPSQHLERLCKDLDAGRRNASSDVARISPVYWDDVGGLDHVRAEIMDAIELPLKHPHLFPPGTGRSGILLFGPPGTGKTLIAKAVATECGLPFLSIKGPELLGSYVGESEANIREVFSSAKRAAENNLPIQASILFFDELDSLAPKRGSSNHGGGVMERVVASLLSELDGGGNTAEDSSGRVFVLGATNRPDLLDPSLLRPGRLDRLVYLGIPTDDRERTRVLASQLRKMDLEGEAFEMARTIIGSLPPRLSGADMSKLSNGAMLNAIQRLCRQADREREERQKMEDDKNKLNGTPRKEVTVDEILEGWSDEKCTPIVTLEDLRIASRDVSSSVTEEELQRYERLRAAHANTNGNSRSLANESSE